MKKPKRLDRLITLSNKHNLDSRIDIHDGYCSVVVHGNGSLVGYQVQEEGETTNHVLGRAIKMIETECGDKPDDKITVDISVRLYDEGHRDEWIDREFDLPLKADDVVENLRLVMMSAYKGYGSKPTPYGSWFDRIKIYVRRQDKTIADIGIARYGVSPRSWRTTERYPREDRSASTVTTILDEVPTAHVVGRLIMNAVRIAERYAKLDNRALQQMG